MQAVASFLAQNFPNVSNDPWDPLADFIQKQSDPNRYPLLKDRATAFDELLYAAGNSVIHPLVCIAWVIVGLAHLMRPMGDETRGEVLLGMLKYLLAVPTNCLGQIGRVFFCAAAVVCPFAAETSEERPNEPNATQPPKLPYEMNEMVRLDDQSPVTLAVPISEPFSLQDAGISFALEELKEFPYDKVLN